MRLAWAGLCRSLRFGFAFLVAASLFQAKAAELPPGVQNSSTPASTPAAPVISVSSPSQHQAALNGQNQNKSSGGQAKAIGSALLAAGTAMMAACAAQYCMCCPAAAQMIMQGLQGLAQGDANDSTAGDHGAQAGLNVDTSSPYGAKYDVSSPNLSNPSDFSSNKDVVKKLAEMEKYGTKFNAKNGSLTLPNGKTLGLMDGAAAWQNAGVSPEELKQNLATAKAIEAKVAAEAAKKIGAHTESSGFEGGSGGGSTSSPPREEENGVRGREFIERKPTSMAGMIRNYNGENIGVSGDDIFSMMTRRYKEKAGKDSFLSPESVPDAIAN